MGGPDIPKSPDPKTAMPSTAPSQLVSRAATPLPQSSRPMPMQPTGAPSYGETLASAGTQSRQFDPRMVQQMLGRTAV